jgi:hypothetical protein
MDKSLELRTHDVILTIELLYTHIDQASTSGQAVVVEGSLSEGFELPYMQLVVITRLYTLNLRLCFD